MLVLLRLMGLKENGRHVLTVRAHGVPKPVSQQALVLLADEDTMDHRGKLPSIPLKWAESIQ